MDTAYLLVTILFAAMVAFSAIAKIRRDPRVVHVIQEVVGVPLQFFPLLAACELAGALGLVLGGRRSRHWPRNLLCWRSRIASARGRCQRHGARCVHADSCGRSACAARAIEQDRQVRISSLMAWRF